MTTVTHRTMDPAATSIEFGPFRLLPTQRLLSEAGRPVHLGSRAFDILVTLLERPGELVTKEELMARVWPNTFVAPANLAVHISALRRALGDGHGGNRYVVNIPGRGYRFVAAVTFGKDLPADLALGELTYGPDLPVPFNQPIADTENIDESAQQLQRRQLLAIVGQHGIDTRTVALAVVEKLAGAHQSGVWLVDLTPIARS